MINRNTLFYTYVLLMCTEPSSDVVARRYVNRYISLLHNQSNAQYRGMVCEMLWSVPNVSMTNWLDLSAAVGYPNCNDWSSYAFEIQEQIAYSLDATRNQWERFPFSVCQFTDKIALQIQLRVCGIERGKTGLCEVTMGSPHWCSVCAKCCEDDTYNAENEKNAKTRNFYIVLFVPLATVVLMFLLIFLVTFCENMRFQKPSI